MKKYAPTKAGRLVFNVTTDGVVISEPSADEDSGDRVDFSWAELDAFLRFCETTVPSQRTRNLMQKKAKMEDELKIIKLQLEKIKQTGSIR